MRSNKGITLTSLIIYIIVFTMVVSTVATISGYFTKNSDDVVISTESAEQYSKLTTYITDDLNSINFKSINVVDEFIEINFLDNTNHIYLYNKNNIYYMQRENGIITKNIIICKNINDYEFLFQDNKLKISVTIDEITYNNYYSVK